MSNYKCTKCGWEVVSKCVQQRNSFPVEDMGRVATLRAIMIVDVEPDSGRVNGKDIVIRLTSWDENPDKGKELYRLSKLLSGLTEEQFKQVACQHTYKITNGECMFGCCKAE